MKRMFTLAALLFAVFSFAQFTIKGEIKGYANQPVLIKMYQDGNQRLVARVTTNDKAALEYKFPMAYHGILTFELSQAAFEMVADNKPITFSTSLKNPNHAFEYAQGINKTIAQYNQVLELYSLRDHTLLALSRFYTPQDKFYNDILDEVSRINNMPLPDLKDANAKYYLETKELLTQLNEDAKAPAEVAATAKMHMINEDDKLERYGFLNDFISVYISNSLGTARTKEEAKEKLEEALDLLLEAVVAETPRGQNILTTIIPMLDGNGFPDLSKKYLTLASAMSCEKTGDLQDILAVQENIQVGKKAPNFNLEGTKAKSLYQVKAEKKLLIFWASWCPHCMHEMPFVKEFYTNFKKEGGEIVAVSLDIDKDKYKEAIKDFDWINYSDLLKWDGPIVKQYGVMATPTMILLDKNNNILKIGSRVSEFMTP